MKRSFAAVITGAALLLSACGTDPSAPVTPTVPPSASPSETSTPTPSPSASSASPSASSATPTGSGSPSPSTSGSGLPSAAVTESGQPAVNGTVILFPAPGLELKSNSDINTVVGLSTEARTFLTAELDRVKKTASGGCTPFITLDAVRVPDLMSGGESGCGGAAILWARVNGTWKMAVGGQDAPDCTAIRAAGIRTTIPAGFFGAQCLDNGQLVDFKP